MTPIKLDDHPVESDRDSSNSSIDNALFVFLSQRARLFGIAYRILGSAADAEDVVQNAWLRWQTTDRSAVVDPPAFLATMTARLAINLAESAHSRRQGYIGPWLPEPVDTRADPRLGAERGEALGLAVLALMEKLTARERGAYVLREAFDYSYERIAEILGLEEANARQLVSRAKKHVADNRRAPVDRAEQRRLMEAFVVAAQAGDASALEHLFAADVASVTDGNGIVHAARVPVVGRERVAKFLAGFRDLFWARATVEWVEMNGEPSLVFLLDGTIIALAAMSASAEGIYQIMWYRHPSKLAAVAAALHSATP
jgi:RNA polymerase sigma-70 factor, ECF subfamily